MLEITLNRKAGKKLQILQCDYIEVIKKDSDNSFYLVLVNCDPIKMKKLNLDEVSYIDPKRKESPQEIYNRIYDK